MARTAWADDYQIGTPAEALLESGVELLFPFWGQGAVLDVVAPTQVDNTEARTFFGRMERASATPGMMTGLAAIFLEIDVREVARTVHAPTLLIHKRHDRLVNVRHSRWLAENMPNARLLELPGMDHNPWYEGVEDTLSAVKEFLTGTPYTVEPDRVLATVLFTDIVDSTQTAAEMGDARWRDSLEEHQRVVRETLPRYGGREIKTIGDGFLATFDGPARGIRCARRLVESLAAIGVRIRAGLHTGECEVMGDDIGGVAVHIAARVSALAQGGEVLVSRTVKDLVAGSGIEFADRGEHELKGVPDRWQLLAVADG
jgi:class 3 adenylate cyclase